MKVKRICGNKIEVASLDVLDETPLLDIKPYLPRFDAPATKSVGWFGRALKKKKPRLMADNRFADKKPGK